MAGITLLGLGPGDPNQLTREAWDVLSAAEEIWVRTRQHPTIAALPAELKIHSFDELYDDGDTFEAVYAAITERVIELGGRAEGVIYGVPGHPFVAEATGPEIARKAGELDIPVRLIEGLSFLEPTFSALGLDPYPRLTLFDALTLGQAHVPVFAPDGPVLVAQIYSRVIAAEVKSTLTAIYPDEHPARFVHAAGTHDQLVEDLSLYEIDRSQHIGLLSSLLPPASRRGLVLRIVPGDHRAPAGAGRLPMGPGADTRLAPVSTSSRKRTRRLPPWMPRMPRACKRNSATCCSKSF